MNERYFGRWQKAILARLRDEPDGFVLNELLPNGYTPTEYTALHDASRSLEAGGFIRTSPLKDGRRGRPRLWVTRGRRKLPALPPAQYVVASIRLPQIGAKETDESRIGKG
jgi:hypothetical protein